MFKHLFKIHSKPKSSLHGLWYILGAAGLGYLLGRKKTFKLISKKEGKPEKRVACNPKQGWYGIVDKELDNEFREDLKQTDEANDRAVVVEQKVKNGFPTETILKRS